ncbi:hypothetical protein BR93DRAFT_931003 [Coniochaeta sp. PMI_546]|nr:hypothetical protein BR93DRAFT_931003 [Coniochaeta sp. PMI_546]
MTANIKYEALSSDASSETSDAAVAQFKSNFQRRKHFNVLSFSTGCLTTIVVVAVTIFVHRILLAPKTAEQLEAEDWNDCGRSVDVARARGCVMEPMFYGFMPSRCVFPELSNQFPVFEDRPYYSDENMTQLVTPEELWNGKYSVVYTAK